MGVDDWTESLRDIGQDLITIEVNTIESTQISGRKMPSYPHALLDVVQKYADFLVGPAVGLELDKFAGLFGSKGSTEGETRTKLTSPIDFKRREKLRQQGHESLDREMATLTKNIQPQYATGGTRHTVKLTNGWETFELLRLAANRTLAPVESDKPAAVSKDPKGSRAAAPQSGRPQIGRNTRGILWRIARNCDQLKLVADDLRRNPDSREFIGKTRRELVSSEKKLKPASPQYLTQIRKTWDIGTDTIVLQTVVQLDGDITYRTRPNLVRDSKLSLLEAHERATNVGLEHWQSLFQLVFSLLVDKIGRIFSARD